METYTCHGNTHMLWLQKMEQDVTSVRYNTILKQPDLYGLLRGLFRGFLGGGEGGLDVYLEHSRTSTMELFAKIVNS